MHSHKKGIFVLALALVACYVLSGCSAMLQPENQAYALALSIDRTLDGLLEVGVLFQEISASGSSTEGEEGGADASKPLCYFVLGSSFAEALDLLIVTTPRTLNLSQLKSVFISEQTASDPSFKSLIEHLMLTNDKYGTPYMVVCQGSAKDFIQQIKPKLGSGLASELSTSLEHYAEQGYTPLVRLADLYYAINSIYGDPIVTFGALDKVDATQLTLPPGLLGDALPGTLPSSGPLENKFMGTALIKDGAMIGVLDGTQTRWMQVLTGQLSGFNYICQGLSLRVAVNGAPKISVDTRVQPPSIRIKLNVVPSPMRQMPDHTVLDQQMRAELGELFEHCQSLSVDPFNFAKYAAMKFLTYDDFVRYNWRQRFHDASIQLDLNISGAY